MPEPDAIILGILAGGRATRLGGIDKAWLQRKGEAQVHRLARRFAGQVGGVLVSANRRLADYEASGLPAFQDRTPDIGPLGGLDALAQACTTDWLLTLPVDVVSVNDCLLPSLAAAAGKHGAYAHDEDGVQPLVALWPVASLRDGANAAIEAGELAIHTLQSRLGMIEVRFAGVRFGNLNTPDDLAAAGFEMP
ncbi:molybdopterin-guanine dinucleotide biosynthesis protein A [Luteimonas cucumeris]|uniref:Molybdenum cofactor guanylyltransferase n=1 Tax=Luteimonas cucumeris TaxID=985012 RepID=A0A562L884_9GAMM|nr:NTP transferase domain-containing protein [Luteimonas cucumeris]TWI03869.1 molybdopterin-guanine dinucleotide biosynthesis protein A [Luteimonas cucumeris]